MSDLKKILKEEYDKKKLNITPKLLMEMIYDELGLLTEGQKGTAFERVIVDLAKNGYDAIMARVAELETQRERAKKDEAFVVPASQKKTKTTLLDLSVRALKTMGYEEEQIKKGVDPDAVVFPKPGDISGDPKTDVVIGGKRISLKLPKAIQLGSGGVKITYEVFQKALLELEENIEAIDDVIEKEARIVVFDKLNEQLSDMKNVLIDESKGRFYPAMIPGTKKSSPKTYREALIHKLTTREKNPLSEEAAVIKAEQIEQQNFANLLREWNAWNDGPKEDLNMKLQKLIQTDREFITIIIDEYLSGRRTFEKFPECVADYLLSPDSFYNISTMEQSGKLIDDNFIKTLNVQARGKGRPNLTKEVAVRFEFDQKKYRVLKEAALVAAACDINNTEAVKGSLNESLSKCTLPINALQKLANTTVVKFEDDPENNP